MYDKDDTQKKVFQIISEVLKQDITQLKETNTFEELGADSLDRLEIIMKFEEQFGIDISDDQESEIKSLAQAVEAIHPRRTK
jgi:acyl carrier protein